MQRQVKEILPIVAGLDPGSKKAAIAIVDGKARILKIYGFSSRKRVEVRKKEFWNFVRNTLAESKPNFVFIEKPYVYFNSSSALLLAQFIGIAEAVCIELGISYTEIAASRVKKMSVGGRVSKELSHILMKQMYPELESASFDEIDAVAVALAGLNVLKENDLANRYFKVGSFT